MELVIDFPDVLIVEDLLIQKNIPCTVRVPKNFEIVFPKHLGFWDDVIGIILDISVTKIEERVPPSAGGEYSYYRDGLISIKHIRSNVYHVEDLAMFDASLGWCQIIRDGEYAEQNDYMKKAGGLL